MPKLIWEKKLQEAVKRQQRFGWSISGCEKNNKSITKVFYRYQESSINSILDELVWATYNSNKMMNLV